MTGEKERLHGPVKYEGINLVVIANNSRFPFAKIGDVVFSLKNSQSDLKLKGVYYIPGMKNNLLLVAQFA